MRLMLVFSIIIGAACVGATETEGVRRLMVPSYDIVDNDDGVVISFPSSLLLSGATTSGSSSEDTQFRVQRGSSDEHYVGTTDGEEQTLNVLLRDDQIVVGSIVDEKDGNVYKLSTNASGDLEATVTHTSEFPPEVDAKELEIVDDKYNPPVRHLRAQTSGNFRERGLQTNCPLNVVDVLVLWSADAECQESGFSAGCTRSQATEQKIRDLIDLAIAETNTAYEYSGVRVDGEFAKLNLAHAYYEPTFYDRSDIGDMVQFISRSSVIDAKRTEYAADVVAAIAGENNSCGQAYFLGPRIDIMHSVTSIDCATGYYTFGHLIGLNMGADHDRGSLNSCWTSKYNYGFRDPAGRFRTILATDCRTGQCDKNSSNSCTRVQRFSNDEFLYNGSPIGGESVDNARQHSDVFATVSAYYQCIPVTEIPTSTPTANPNKTPSSMPSIAVTEIPTSMPTIAVCTESELIIDLTTDRFPDETKWTVENSSGNVIAENPPLYEIDSTTTKICLTTGCYTFEITDTYGDGICCEFGFGEYTVTFDGNEKKKGDQFAYSESVEFCTEISELPSESPTANPNESPNGSPTSSESPTNVCFDSVLGLSAGSNATCPVISANIGYCDYSSVQSHCPVICDSCVQFRCADSTLAWNYGGDSYTCQQLSNFPDSDLESYCLLEAFYSTCRETCNTCNV